MKIQVVRVDGTIEIINLVGEVTANEPHGDLEFPRNQSPLVVNATGMRYYFREDGIYDGWEMAIEGSGMDWDEAKKFAEAIESDREIVPPKETT